jgi:hypothetical protein
MRRPLRTDGGTVVDPTDRTALRRALEQFADVEAVDEMDDGSVRARFGSQTHLTVTADGHVDAGMPLHSFTGPADHLEFDHDAGEIRVRTDEGEDAVAYVFRRP